MGKNKLKCWEANSIGKFTSGEMIQNAQNNSYKNKLNIYAFPSKWELISNIWETFTLVDSSPLINLIYAHEKVPARANPIKST